MNPDLFFRTLQVAVVAPWLYSASRDVESPYFNVGLKLVAGAIVGVNAPVLWAAYRRYGADAIAQWAADQAKPVRGRVIDSEGVQVL